MKRSYLSFLGLDLSNAIGKGICHASLHKETTVDFCPVKDLLKSEEKKYLPF